MSISDEPDTAEPSKKRLHKSVMRSMQWLDEVVKAFSGKAVLFAPLIGSDNHAARRAYAQHLLDKENGASLDSRIHGYSLQLTHYQDLPPDDLASLLRSSLDALSPDKLRLVTGLATPHAILRLIRSVGVDIIVDHVSYMLADLGVALDFDFGDAALPILSDQPRDLGINVHEAQYATAFRPISTSSLAKEANSKQLTTLAYINHLLWRHEMTAHVLLTLHNARVMKAFMAEVRRLIRANDGSFERACEVFETTYSEAMSSLEQATADKAAVTLERGKGKDKRSRLAESLTASEGPTALPALAG